MDKRGDWSQGKCGEGKWGVGPTPASGFSGFRVVLRKRAAGLGRPCGAQGARRQRASSRGPKGRALPLAGASAGRLQPLCSCTDAHRHFVG